MLNPSERQAFLDLGGDTDAFLTGVHVLLDTNRIQDIPDAAEFFLAGCDLFATNKKGTVYSTCIVGPIVNRYILPALDGPLSRAEMAFPSWSQNPANRLIDRLREAMVSGDHLKAEADAIIAEVKASVL